MPSLKTSRASFVQSTTSRYFSRRTAPSSLVEGKVWLGAQPEVQVQRFPDQPAAWLLWECLQLGKDYGAPISRDRVYMILVKESVLSESIGGQSFRAFIEQELLAMQEVLQEDFHWLLVCAVRKCSTHPGQNSCCQTAIWQWWPMLSDGGG